MRFVAVLLLSCLVASAAGAARRPNVVFILADDLGWADTTLYGHTRLYQTPNIERLARRGMVFIRAYANSPLCSPTRASILTGQTPARHGSTAPQHHTATVRLRPAPRRFAAPGSKAVAVDSVTRLDTRYPTLAKRLKQAGYATGHFGKWHLGPEPYSALDHGFDVDIPHWAGPGPAGSFVAPWKFPNFKAASPGEHIEDRMAAEAVKWMNSLPADQPFFLNYWQFSVHAPFDAKKELIEKYRGRIDPSQPQRSPTYAAMVESLDDAVGTLLDAVDRSGRAANTVFVFTSDNGGNMYNGVPERDRNGREYLTAPTSNRPLRGGKATVFEGGIRVPAIVVWPGVTAPGSRSDEIIQASDFYPTLLRGLNLPLPDKHPIDGIDITPALRGGRLRREAIFTYFPHEPAVPDWLPPSAVAHSGDWKLIRIFYGGENGAHDYRLYNLRHDLGESTNLAAEYPEKVAELDRLIERHLTDTAAVRPLPNPRFDPAQFHPEQIGVQRGGLRVGGKPRPKARSSAARSGKAPALKGWRPGGDAAPLKTAGHALILRATGRDPQLVLAERIRLRDGPFTLEVRLKADRDGQAIAFCNPPWRRGAFESMGKVQAGRWSELSAKFEVEELTGLRIDPFNRPGQAEFQWIRVRNAEDQIVRTWEF